jgi:hypothetical protein
MVAGFDFPLLVRGGAARLGSLLPSRSGVGAVRLALRLLDMPHPNPSPKGEGL